MEPISIPLSKTKILILFAGAILFVAGGCWLLIRTSTANAHFSSVPIIAGMAAILFFGLCAVYAARKFFSKKPGLLLDDLGITDNSSGISAGFIPWSDIQEINMLIVRQQKFIMIFVKTPEEYIDKQHSFIKRKMMLMNYKMYGSPLAVSANGLATSFGELFNLVRHQFELRYQKE